MFVNKILIVLLVLVISSCELTDSDAAVAAAPDPSDSIIEGEFSIEATPEGILKEKFSEASLVCNLWFQKGEKLNLDIEPARTFNWDLINDFTLEGEFSLVERIDALASIAVVAKVKKFEVSTVLVNKDGDLFTMLYNPWISMTFTHTTTDSLASDININTKGSSERNFKHNSESVVVLDNKRTIEGDTALLFTYLKCDFKTKAITSSVEI
mgnify:CR=1 FL=1